MADLIAPVIISSFAGVAVLVILGFFLVRQRSGRPRFESQDYYKSYKRPERSSTSPFKQQERTPQERNQNRIIGIVIIALVVTAITVSILYDDPFEGILIFILLPVIVRFLRARNETRRAPRDESQSY
jgi:hypothetical protein